MKTLFNFELTAKVAVYVPGTTDVNKPVDTTIFQKKAIEDLAKMFGGATAVDCLGGYVASNGELITEKITKVYAYCTPSLFEEKIKEVYNLALYLKEELKQESVLVEYNGQAAFV